ncbi:hypothetical protein AB0230_12085 [Microbacterium sp. NPDC089190]|uniref:hypothetical protein n=1 Tax=Microbacterium sp. NPDC089190 TaxID=3155063 RepID=UPI00344E2D49
MTTPPPRSVPLSMWLCTAAVIVFAAVAPFDIDGVGRWNIMALGLALVIAGGVRLGVELPRA